MSAELLVGLVFLLVIVYGAGVSAGKDARERTDGMANGGQVPKPRTRTRGLDARLLDDRSRKEYERHGVPLWRGFE